MKKLILIIGIIGLVLFYLKPNIYSTYSSPACHSRYVCSTHIGMSINAPEWFVGTKMCPSASKYGDKPWSCSYDLEETVWDDCSNMCE